MTKLEWDKAGEHFYETGVDHGVLYPRSDAGEYDNAIPWNGLTTVTESPSGAESNKQYADNIVYLDIRSAEEFGGTIEALYAPLEFEQCDGSAELQPGVSVGQQGRRSFGFSYRTRLGNEIVGDSLGYKLHLVYGATVSPSEKARSTVNDSPEPTAFSWEFTTIPVAVGTLGGVEYRPTSKLTIDSTQVDADALAALEDILYGTVGADGYLPLPDEVFALFAGTLTEVETSAPTYNSSTDIITIPSVTGVEYLVDGEVVTGTYGPITEDTVVTARATAGYRLSATSDNDWTINFA